MFVQPVRKCSSIERMNRRSAPEKRCVKYETVWTSRFHLNCAVSTDSVSWPSIKEICNRFFEESIIANANISCADNVLSPDTLCNVRERHECPPGLGLSIDPISNPTRPPESFATYSIL
jgi:hypothetical protein